MNDEKRVIDEKPNDGCTVLCDGRLFYIISLKWSHGDTICFWGANNAGYTEHLPSAGKYTKKQVDDNQSYYNNGEDTIAVECDEVEKWSKFISILYDHNKIKQLKLKAIIKLKRRRAAVA